MNKMAHVLMVFCFSGSLFADANIADVDPQKTFLLTAPGTLSGALEESQTQPQAQPPMPARPADTRWQPQPYRFVGEDAERFPQHGQQPGYNNPWTEDPPSYAIPGYRGAYSVPTPSNNPWHVEGDYSPEFDMTQSERFPYNASQIYSPGLYEPRVDYYSDYTNGIYRDSNPAASYPPMFNDFMPGLGGEGLDFPFMPFGRF